MQTRVITDLPHSHHNTGIHKAKLSRQTTLFIWEHVFHEVTATLTSAVQMWWCHLFQTCFISLKQQRPCLFREGQICCAKTVKLNATLFLDLQSRMLKKEKVNLNRHSQEQSHSLVMLTLFSSAFVFWLNYILHQLLPVWLIIILRAVFLAPFHKHVANTTFSVCVKNDEETLSLIRE